MKRKSTSNDLDARVKELIAKKLPPITAEEKAELAWKGTFEPIPFVAKPGARPSEKYNIFAMMNGYENEAREILKAGGYPLTLDELTGRKERRIRDIINMLLCFREVRVYISLNDAENSAASMAYAIRSAMLARIRPAEPLIDVGEKVVGGGKQGGKKSGTIRREKATPTKESWQAEAEKIWSKRPSWRKKRVAEEIVKRIDGNAGTIRKSIKKPLP
jgi:hypothetical protein